MNHDSTQPLASQRKMPVAADYLAGETPHQRAAAKRRRVIDWVYRWGYSSSTIIQRLGGSKGASLAAALDKAGVLRSTRTESGGVLDGVPAKYFTLTEAGLQDAEKHTDVLLRYPEIDPYRVNQGHLRHFLIAQELVVKPLLSGAIEDYLTERMIDLAGDEIGIKKPDFVVINAEGVKIATEVELSAKWGRLLDEFSLGVVRTLQTASMDPQVPEYDEFLIVSDAKAIIKRYKTALGPNVKLPIWRKNDHGRWVVDHSITVPSEVSGRIKWLLLD